MKTLKSVRRSVLLLVFVMMMGGTGRGQTLAAKFDEYLTELARLGRFNGYVLVARDGKQIFGKGYGMANFEDEVPNTAQTKFRLASVTKPFTATAILLLQEQGKLNLKDAICQHLKDCPAGWKTITVEQLLAHTSGLADYVTFKDFMATLGTSAAPSEVIARIAEKPLLFAPGERFSYSNSNYYLLGQIIENVSGRPYAAFIQENIFAPLGMKDSGYDDNSTLLKHRAAGYVRQGERIVNARYMDMTKAYSAGALYSTAEDLLRWDAALYTERLISKKSLAAMFTAGQGGVGFGWFISREFNRQLIMQGGLNSGFAVAILRYPEERACIILLNNFENAAPYLARTGRDLSAILFGEKYELPQARTAAAGVDPKTFDAFVGEYDFGQGRTITITRTGDRLFAQKGSGPRDEIRPENETTFFLSTADVQLIFIKDEAGRVAGMILKANGQEFKGRKVK